MDRLLSLRQDIYDHFHSSTIRGDLFLAPGNRDRFAQYEIAMVLIQDTGEALWTHMHRDFSTSPMAAYIEFWGVMQAVIIQQDALLELAAALGSPKPSTGKSWKAIRDFRNVLAGHPAKKISGCNPLGAKPTLRAFMGRQQKSYRELIYEVWDASAEQITHPQANLGAMIGAYEAEAADHLAKILDHMRRSWPVEPDHGALAAC
ncbi:hypothetical protein [Aquabacter cavernae]|uniref:hypothetical protein n=1 Tax=Aquabacter cavernae TaxID=2496029 RepID=UPI000F8E6CB1|nr:hypothetical protein [Aquabacter cavernae]